MDSDEEVEDNKHVVGVPGTIILINAHGNSKYNIFPVAHVATCRLMKQYLRLSNSQNVSVCIYGTEMPSNSTYDAKSVIEIFPLTTPTVNNYKKLRDFDISLYNEVKELKLSDVLWQCSKMFSNFNKQLSSRTIIMLTQLRTPPIAADHKTTLNRVMDLVDSNIAVKIVNVSNEEYKIDQFYENFLLEANKEEDFKVPLPMWDSKEIEKTMHQQSDRHLAVAKMNFEIGSGFSIGVGIYRLLKCSGYTQHKTTNLVRDTNDIVNSITKTWKGNVTNNDVDSVQSVLEKDPLLKSEVLHYQEYGGERVEFTDVEKKAMNNPFGPPMLKLFGFKPATYVCKEKWYFKMSYFLFPNESSVEGSTVAFNALHKACKALSVVAICVLCTRVNAKPILVALSPTTRPLGLDVELGFDVIVLPFVENVRELPNITENDDESATVDEANKSVMRDILKCMKFDYKSDIFENPKLQSQYRALESIALEEDDIDPFIDTTHPDPNILNRVNGELFEEIFGTFAALSVKRSVRSENLLCPATKKRKPESSKTTKVLDIEEDLLQDKIKSRSVNTFKVAELKNILKSKHMEALPALTGLNKAELVDLVYKYCSK